MIGTGYVGLVSGTCFADLGNKVYCVDKDKNKINKLKNAISPIYEPGLDDLIRNNFKAKRLDFTSDIEKAVKDSQLIFICVGTPTKKGSNLVDLSQVFNVAKSISKYIKSYKVIITKSTVPVGTGRQVEAVLREANPEADFDVVSNPEFLREGSAINDFMRPNRVVVGAENERAIERMRALYRPLYLIEKPVLFTSLETAELIKYAANAFLAVKISYINQMADLCEAVGADVHDVAKGMGLDNRIGSKFLHPGPGYGGSCFPKDTLALVKTAELFDVPVSIVSDVVAYNAVRKSAMAARVIRACGDNVSGKNIAVLGLSFKPETDDMRESPALDIISTLCKSGANIIAYDPAAIEEARPLLPESVVYVASAQDCLKGADCAVVVTEWNEFRALTPHIFQSLMAGPILVDLRNIYEPSVMREHGIDYTSIGRK